MQKRIVGRAQQEAALPDQDWLNVERLADVEVSSEDAEHPIEAALLPSTIGLARRRARETDNPAALHLTTTAATDLAGICGIGD
jgi:hypothetical protein